MALGDCLEVLPGLQDGSVSHVITDPPYEAEAHTLARRIKRTEDRGSRWGGSDDRVAAVEPIGFAPISDAEREAFGMAVPPLVRRWLLVFCQVEAAPRWSLALSVGGASRYIRTAVWVKPDAQPQLSGDRPGMGYESICIQHRPGRTRWNGGGRVGVFEHCKSPTDGKAPHPTTKPLALMSELVELFTDPGDLVLDPFAGSGTTGVACLRLGRRFIGIEKDERYWKIACDRLTAEGQGMSLKSYRDGQLPMFAEATK